MEEQLKQRTDRIVHKAIGLFRQYIFLCPIIHSVKYCESIKGGYQVEGLNRHRSMSKRYLIMSICQLWDEELKNKKQQVTYPISSIPGIQSRLPEELPEPEPYCHDGRAKCRVDLREEKKAIWASLRYLRDKSIAHSELTICDKTDKVDHIDTDNANLNNQDLFDFLFSTLEIVQALDSVVRESGFSWQELAETEKRIAAEYFKVDDFEIKIPQLNVIV